MMDKTEILELFEITNKKVAQIQQDTETKIAQIRKEAERYRKEAERYRKEAERYRKDTDKRLNNVAEHLGGHTQSIAEATEEYFYRCLKGHPYLGNIHFDDVLWDEKYNGRQFDIVMRNEYYIALVSVKTKVKERAVINLIESDLPALKQFYTGLKFYKDVKFIGVVAGLSYQKRALEKANTRGVFILTQSEDKSAKLVNEDIVPSIF